MMIVLLAVASISSKLTSPAVGFGAGAFGGVGDGFCCAMSAVAVATCNSPSKH